MSSFVRLDSVYVRYPIFNSSRQQSILNAVAESASFGLIRRSSDGITHVDGVLGVSIELKAGARLGIIGRNGSGKSTLLKTLAGINWPQRGTRTAQGRVSSLLTVGSGLDWEKTGRANTVFICKLFGITPERTQAIVDETIEFTGLADFFDLPIRAYSAGMVVRLSFALATALEGDILIVDEVLGAGDIHFLERAAERFRARVGQSSILALATHSPHALTEFCETAICMNAGRVVDIGAPAEVWGRFERGEVPFPSGIDTLISLPAVPSASDGAGPAQSDLTATTS